MYAGYIYSMIKISLNALCINARFKINTYKAKNIKMYACL